MSDSFVSYSISDAVFTDGTSLSGTWTVEYNAAGTIVAVTSFDLVATENNVSTTFTSAGTLPYANPNAQGDYELHSLAQTGNNETALYLDWNGLSPAALNTPGSTQVTSIKDAEGQDVTLASTGVVTSSVVCFMPGTRIATPAGEREIETLAVGGAVSLADGGVGTIRWIGRQTVSTRFADPLRVLPIRISAGALGEGLPVRDLLVSPCHAVRLDGVLVQAGALVDGVGIYREAEVPEVFIYYHVELSGHELLLAEGVPAESFVDNIDRMNFDNWDEHQALQAGVPAVLEMDLPRVKAARQLPRQLRERLVALAQAGRRNAA
jgi:hypothetical protein